MFKAILKQTPLKEETIVMARLMGTPQMIRKNRKEELVALKTLHGEQIHLNEKKSICFKF